MDNVMDRINKLLPLYTESLSSSIGDKSTGREVKVAKNSFPCF